MPQLTKVLYLLTAAACASAADPILRITEAEAKKAALERPAPEYPLVARQLKVTGSVALEATVSPEGVVSQVRIVSGSPILTKAAADALRKWKFRPFKEDGKPAAALVTLSFEFDTH